MYFADLTPYAYPPFLRGSPPDPRLLNVGWLDTHHSFSVGDLPERIIEQLLWVCVSVRTNITRGYYPCPFCPKAASGTLVTCQGKQVILGSAEIRLAGANGQTYAAPNLVYHYVKRHRYLPPGEFLAALSEI